MVAAPHVLIASLEQKDPSELCWHPLPTSGILSPHLGFLHTPPTPPPNPKDCLPLRPCCQGFPRSLSQGCLGSSREPTRETRNPAVLWPLAQHHILVTSRLGDAAAPWLGDLGLASPSRVGLGLCCCCGVFGWTLGMAVAPRVPSHIPGGASLATSLPWGPAGKPFPAFGEAGSHWGVISGAQTPHFQYFGSG